MTKSIEFFKERPVFIAANSKQLKEAVARYEGEAEGAFKIFRGGGAGSVPARCRVSNRSSAAPKSGTGIGFRLAMTIPGHYKR